MMTLITMGQGNVKALRRTIESFTGLCNEIIFGDLFIFEEDRTEAHKLCSEFNIRFVQFPFNYIFKNGFACILNELAKHATNDMVIYMNVSEVIDKNFRPELIDPKYNAYCFNHARDPHIWYRCYNRKELYWSGIIHEIVVGASREAIHPCVTPLFMMADTEKDMDDPFKAKVFNDVKELVYFNQYVKLVDYPHMIQWVDPGWVRHAKEGYSSFVERLQKKGNRYEAFKIGNLDVYLNDIFSSKDFEEDRQISSVMINFQGARKDIL